MVDSTESHHGGKAPKYIILHYHWRSVAEQSSNAGLATLFGISCFASIVFIVFAWHDETRSLKRVAKASNSRESPQLDSHVVVPPETATSPMSELPPASSVDHKEL